jgi:hypothetical protein
MSPSKDALRAMSIKQDKREHVASKSVSFCEDTASYEVASKNILVSYLNIT